MTMLEDRSHVRLASRSFIPCLDRDLGAIAIRPVAGSLTSWISLPHYLFSDVTRHIHASVAQRTGELDSLHPVAIVCVMIESRDHAGAVLAQVIK